MKVQLILFPQNFKGAEVPMNEPPMEHIVNNSLRMFGPSKYINNWQPCGQALVQKAIDSAWSAGGGFFPFPSNAWLGYGKNSNGLGTKSSALYGRLSPFGKYKSVKVILLN